MYESRVPDARFNVYSDNHCSSYCGVMTGATEFVTENLILKHSPENGFNEPADIMSIPN